MPTPAAAPISDLELNGQLHRCAVESVGVIRTAEESRLIALRPIRAGEPLFHLEGSTSSQPSRYSVQIDENLHLVPDGDHGPEEMALRFYWQYLNHGCEPSALVHERQLVARRDIQPGEPVTFNYNTTEWDMSSPFQCRCGTTNCLKVIRGFKHLTPAQRAALPTVAPHLKRAAARTNA